MSLAMSPSQQSEVPRPEHPRPQFVRPEWLSLNGEWEFEIDQGDSGFERGLHDSTPNRHLATTIRVPFAPESELSGVCNTDFLEAVWYRRTILVPERWTGRRVLLHFQAVDHDSTVWVNGVEVARHRGGFTPFTADLRGVAKPGEEVTIVVRARDSRHGPQARGKQSTSYANSGVRYTRTTGIWQTVWLEAVPETFLRRPRITPDVAGSAFHLELPLSANRRGLTARAVLYDDAGEVARGECRADVDRTPLAVSPRQFAIEAEIVLQGANAIGELRDVRQHAEWTTHPAAHGGDAIPDGPVFGRESVAIGGWKTAHAGGKRIRVPGNTRGIAERLTRTRA
jgi:beta-galactosidase/beta-glucuronidase